MKPTRRNREAPAKRPEGAEREADPEELLEPPEHREKTGGEARAFEEVLRRAREPGSANASIPMQPAVVQKSTSWSAIASPTPTARLGFHEEVPYDAEARAVAQQLDLDRCKANYSIVNRADEHT